MRIQIFTSNLRNPKINRLLLVIALTSLIGCFSISKTTSLNVWSNEGETFISVEIPTNEISFNWHGGGWWNGLDRYKLTIPRKTDKVDGERIILNRGIGATDSVVQVSRDSRVEILGRSACSIEIRVFDQAGKPYALNGTYRLESSCGR
jgi:hypothetical protein